MNNQKKKNVREQFPGTNVSIFEIGQFYMLKEYLEYFFILLHFFPSLLKLKTPPLKKIVQFFFKLE